MADGMPNWCMVSHIRLLLRPVDCVYTLRESETERADEIRKMCPRYADSRNSELRGAFCLMVIP